MSTIDNAEMSIEMIEQGAKALWHRFAPGHHMEWEDEPHKAEYRQAAADLFALRAQEGWRIVPVATLELVYSAMNHMGDALNGMDAVTEEDEALATPAFEAMRSLLIQSQDEKDWANG